MFRRGPRPGDRARRVVEAFRQHGATSPEKALTSEDLGLPGRFDEFMDRKGGKSGIIVEVSEGRYYLDETKLGQARNTQGEKTVIVKEREIVKLRCSYCGNLYEITENKCPTCGAPAGK